eukprot:s2531_g2.t1
MEHPSGNLFCLLLFSCYLPRDGHLFRAVSVSDSEEATQFTEVAVPQSFSAADIYAMVLSLLLALPAIPVTVAIVVLYILPLCVIYIYSCTLPRPLDIVQRSCGFYVMTLGYHLGLEDKVLWMFWP